MRIYTNTSKWLTHDIHIPCSGAYRGDTYIAWENSVFCTYNSPKANEHNNLFF